MKSKQKSMGLRRKIPPVVPTPMLIQARESIRICIRLEYEGCGQLGMGRRIR